MPALPPYRWQSHHIVISVGSSPCQEKIWLILILMVYVVPSTHPGTITISLSLAQIFTYSDLRVQNLVLYDFEECHRQKNYPPTRVMGENQRRDRNECGNKALEVVTR